MSRRKSHARDYKSPLQQTRFADLNYSFQTVNHNRQHSAKPSSDKQKQVGLEAFGFLLQPGVLVNRTACSNPTRLKSTPDSPPSSVDGSPPCKRRKFLREVKEYRSLEKEEREIPETQCESTTPLTQEGLQFEGLGSMCEKTPPVVSPPTPTSVPALQKLGQNLGLRPMLPPPVTPKRRIKSEIPSSHTPPITPLSPYHPSPRHSPERSPLSSRRQVFQLPARSQSLENGRVESSQWWELEDTQHAVLATQKATETDEENDICSDTYLKGPLFATVGTNPASTSPTVSGWTQPDNGPQLSGKVNMEKSSLTKDISSGPFASEVAQQGCISISTSTPMYGRKIKEGAPKIKKETNDEFSSLETFPEYQVKSEGTMIIQSHLEAATEELSAHSQQQCSGKCHVSQAPTLSPSMERASPETQYDGTAEYGWWDIDPKLTEGGEANFDGESAGEKYDEEKLEYDDDNSFLEHVTMSQLLPDTLMESFPMPPPMTQWSEISEANSDDDEL